MTAMNRDTGSKELRERHLSYHSDVMPLWKTLEDKLNRRFLESEFRSAVVDEFAVFSRNKAKTAEIFREENTELEAEVSRLSTAWQELMGAMTIEFDGEQLTVQECGAKLQERDREVRERAYLAIVRRRAEDRDRIDEIFDEIVALRHRMARNAGFDNFRDFRFAQMHRFDYTPADCEGFHAAAESVTIPVVRELRQSRRVRLGLETIRPYDVDVSLFDRDPEQLFEDQEGYVDLVRRLFAAIDPVFREDFEILVRNGLLDLMSRPGKAPGGYNCPVEDIRLPFIFFNAVGYARDLGVLLHEGGHAFHTLSCREIPVLDYRHAPAEFAEVASMSMELFGLERMAGLFGEEKAREMAYGHLEMALQVFANVAKVDAFQHWLYTDPGHGRDERRAKWSELTERYTPELDWSGLEEFRGDGWQRLPHLFTHPLYFIEYGIAQLGALQMWQLEREDHGRAVTAYRRALALGGSRPLPELFEAAEIQFGLGEEVFRKVVPDLTEKLRALAPD
jgi:oligoendopeptidase F